MGEFRSLLAAQLDWLAVRVRQHARVAGLSDAQEDLLQETVKIALERLPRFFVGPSRNESARMRCLLLQALKSARTNLYRERAKTPVLGGDAPIERAETEDPESLLAGEQYRRAHLAEVRAELSPGVALVYLCIHFPEEVCAEDLRRAAAFRGGGAQGLARPVDEAWSLFDRLRTERLARTSEAEWKRLVVEVLFSAAPLGEASREDLERGIRNVDTRLARARAKLGLGPSSNQGEPT